jgi:hypothetical protein
MIVEIRPIEKEKWHGKKGEESFQRPITIRALYDPTTMGYATGLNYKDIYPAEDNKEKLTEAEYFSRLLKYDLSNVYDPEKPHPFWDGSLGAMKLENKTMLLDTSMPLNYVHYKMLLASRYVANSLNDYKNAVTPDATHYIYNKEEEIERKAVKANLLKQAFVLESELPRARKIEIINVLEDANLKDQSDNFIEVTLTRLIENRTKDVLRLMKMNKEDLSIHSMILEALQKGVLRKDKGKEEILYFGDPIGTDIYDTIQNLKKEENQDIKLRIIESINN